MGEIIHENTEFVILHGSENVPFVYILYAEYSDILMSASENYFLSLIKIIRQKKMNIIFTSFS